MSYLNALLTDLREKKLWPLAVVLLAALVAVPVLLSKSPAVSPAHPLPSDALPVASNTGAPVTVQVTSSDGALTGKGRDPFTPQPQPKAKTSTATATTPAATTSSTPTSTGGTPVVGGTTTGGGTGIVTPPPPSHNIVPPGGAPHTPTGLQANEAYHVALSIENESLGSVAPLDPIERHDTLPVGQKPMLVFLGVLQGGSRVLFSLVPGTAVSGPGHCIPGPLDCQVLSLGVNQTEALSQIVKTGFAPVDLFAVTGITAQDYPSKAAADAARNQVSKAGSAVLDANASSLSVLSLFPFQSGIDAIVDMRNLTVGGN
jgi:hypothetical protein